MSANSMELNPEVLTGLAFKKFKSKMYSLALGSPKTYYALREACLNQIETEIVNDLYKIFFNALTKGMKKNGTSPIETDGTGGVGVTRLGEPNYPTNLINNLAMDAVADLQGHISKIIDILVPQDLDKISNQQTKISGQAESIEIPK